ncbi:hypothetical protein U3516DRAFT_671119 [Neocallimastix sp. 'constans']
MTSEYIKDNMESFEEIAGDISAISPCSQVVLGVYYLKEENEFKGKELLKSGCSDKYEGYNYALLYIDEKTIEQRNFWKYSEENAKKVLDFLMDHYGCEKSEEFLEDFKTYIHLRDILSDEESLEVVDSSVVGTESSTSDSTRMDIAQLIVFLMNDQGIYWKRT